MDRKARWTRIVDSNLDYLFRNQGEDGTEGAIPGNYRGTSQLAHAAAWAFLEPKSRHCQSEECLARARLAMQHLGTHGDEWKGCPFTPTYVGESIDLLRRVDGLDCDQWLDALLAALNHQWHTGQHTYGHFSDWDVLYALSLALGWKLSGNEGMRAAAQEHARLVWPSVVPDGDGFYYLISPYQFWPPSVNYVGISTSSFARYYEITGDRNALEMITAVKDYFIYFTEPSGLTEFTASPWHKHSTDVKEDTFAFVGGAAEFLASATGDGRLDHVALLMLRNLEAQLKPEGDLQRKPWAQAWTNTTPYDANTTGYLPYAAEWCGNGTPEALPDGYVSERRGINGFKARFGDFGYSVVCGESHVSQCGAWVGKDSILEEVCAQVADGDGVVYGQMAPLWRRRFTRFPDGFAQTSYYQPAEIIGDSWRARYADWRFYQTYLGTSEELIGFVSLESLRDQEGRYVALDLHLGPAGQEVHYGTPDGTAGHAIVRPDNPKPVLISELSAGGWLHYGEIGVILNSVSGNGMTAACYDGVRKQRMFHDGGEGAGDGFTSVISNDLVVTCATPEALHRYAAGERHSVTFVAGPAACVTGSLGAPAPGRYSAIPTGMEASFALAIDHGWRILIALVTHQPWVKPIVLRHGVPEGSYAVRVYSEERGMVIKETTFTGRDFQVEVATASPAAIVELVRRG